MIEKLAEETIRNAFLKRDDSIKSVFKKRFGKELTKKVITDEYDKFHLTKILDVYHLSYDEELFCCYTDPEHHSFIDEITVQFRFCEIPKFRNRQK